MKNVVVIPSIILKFMWTTLLINHKITTLLMFNEICNTVLTKKKTIYAHS
jgi:hypothetical protein